MCSNRSPSESWPWRISFSEWIFAEPARVTGGAFAPHVIRRNPFDAQELSVEEANALGNDVRLGVVRHWGSSCYWFEVVLVPSKVFWPRTRRSGTSFSWVRSSSETNRIVGTTIFRA